MENRKTRLNDDDAAAIAQLKDAFESGRASADDIISAVFVKDLNEVIACLDALSLVRAVRSRLDDHSIDAASVASIWDALSDSDIRTLCKKHGIITVEDDEERVAKLVAKQIKEDIEASDLFNTAVHVALGSCDVEELRHVFRRDFNLFNDKGV